MSPPGGRWARRPCLSLPAGCPARARRRSGSPSGLNPAPRSPPPPHKAGRFDSRLCWCGSGTGRSGPRCRGWRRGAYRDLFTACTGSPCPSQTPHLSFNPDSRAGVGRPAWGSDLRPGRVQRCRSRRARSGTTCPGYFLERRVVGVTNVYRESGGPQSAFQHGGENILPSPGIDVASHTSIVTSCVADDAIGRRPSQ